MKMILIFPPPFQGEDWGGDEVGSTPLTRRSLSGVEGKQPHPHPSLPLEGEGTKSLVRAGLIGI
jgi:hypothetical protein